MSEGVLVLSLTSLAMFWASSWQILPDFGRSVANSLRSSASGFAVDHSSDLQLYEKNDPRHWVLWWILLVACKYTTIFEAIIPSKKK